MTMDGYPFIIFFWTVTMAYTLLSGKHIRGTDFLMASSGESLSVSMMSIMWVLNSEPMLIFFEDLPYNFLSAQ